MSKIKDFLKSTVPYLLILLALSFYMAQFSEKLSPKDSIHELESAIKEHSLVRFNDYFDSDLFIRGLVDDFFDETVGGVNPASELEMVVSAIGMDMLDSIKPKIVASIKRSIIKYVKKGVLEYEKKNADKTELKIADTLEKAYQINGNYRGLKSITADGERRYANFDFYYKPADKVINIKLLMIEESGLWRVVRLSNFSELYEILNHKQNGS